LASELPERKSKGAIVEGRERIEEKVITPLSDNENLVFLNYSGMMH